MELVILCIVSLITSSYGYPTIESNDLAGKKLGIKLTDIVSEDNLEGLLEAFKKFLDDGDVSGIFHLNMNPTVDDAINQLRNKFIRKGMDPLKLDDQTLKLLGIVGSIKLSSGWLQDISTIKRKDDVVVSYNSATKKVKFTLPLSFNVLLFTYNYVTRVTLLKIHGNAIGKIENVALNMNVIFDGNTGKIVLDTVDMKDSGKVTVKFTGNDLVDWITNAMTSVITMVLHPILMALLESGAKSIGNEIVDLVNEYLVNNL